MRQDTAETEGPTVEQPALPGSHQPTIRQKVETAMRKSVSDSTAELAIDDLGLDLGSVDTVDQPGPTAAAASTPDTPTLVAGFDDHSRKVMEDAQRRVATAENAALAGTWSFDQNELEAALTQTSVALTESSDTSRLAALSARGVDVDLSDATGTHVVPGAGAAAALQPGSAETSGGYLVQLGSFGSRTNAERLAKKVRAQGFAVSVSQGSSGHLYRVRVGPAHDRAAAGELAQQLRAHGHSGTIVAQ